MSEKAVRKHQDTERSREQVQVLTELQNYLKIYTLTFKCITGNSLEGVAQIAVQEAVCRSAYLLSLMLSTAVL